MQPFSKLRQQRFSSDVRASLPALWQVLACGEAGVLPNGLRSVLPNGLLICLLFFLLFFFYPGRYFDP